MGKLYVIFLIALAVVHATARDIPNETTKPSMTANALNPAEQMEAVMNTKDAPAANGVGDEKTFLGYGLGGWGGMGFIGGVIPVIPILGDANGLRRAGAGGVGGVGAGGAAGKATP